MRIYPSKCIVTKLTKLYIGCIIKVKDNGFAKFGGGIEKFNGKLVTVDNYYYDDVDGIVIIHFKEDPNFPNTKDRGYLYYRFELDED